MPIGPQAFRSFVQELDATTKTTTTRPGHAESSTTSRVTGEVPAVSQGPEAESQPRETGASGSRCGDISRDLRRTLLKRRLEAAELLAKPFAVRLEADGVSSVRVLARTPVRSWGLPESLVEQMERMLGILVVRTCAAENRHQSKKNNHEGVARGGRALCRTSALQQQRMFDPRFQRSALDPFGRPPRLERIQPCPGKQKHHNNRDGEVCAVADSGSSSADPRSDDGGKGFPPGVWDRPQKNHVVDSPHPVATSMVSSHLPPEATTAIEMTNKYSKILQKLNERSRNIFPEYQRLKRAPQLFRDEPTAPWEGAGAPAARLKLRTDLPPSVKKELAQLQQGRLLPGVQDRHLRTSRPHRQPAGGGVLQRAMETWDVE